MKFIKKHWLEILFVILFIVKCWIVSVQPLYIKNTAHDDGMFLGNAIRVAQGRWLGSYNDITLSKGIIGVLFIAFNYKVHISYLLASQMLYFVACFSFIKILKHITRNKLILLLTYIILLFNPISYSDAVSYVYRDGIYISFIILLVSLSFEMFFHYKDKIKKIIIYQICLGIILASIIYCREETLWILPYIILAFLITILFIIFDKKCINKSKRITCIILIPILIISGYSLVNRTLNYIAYDRFITNDFTSKDFKDAYGALTRVKSTNYLKRVPLNSADRYRLYELSPAFRELESFLEGEDSGKYRASIIKDGKEYRDYKEGFLYWAVREAAYRRGYYVNGQTAKKYYQRLAKEINDLCDSKQIDCFPKRSSLIAPFQKDLIEELENYVPKTFNVQLNYTNVFVEIPSLKKELQGSEEALKRLFGNVTYNKIEYTAKDLKSVNLKVMKIILSIFQKTNYLLFMISLIFYIFIMIVFFKPHTRFKYYKQTLLLNGLLCIYLARVVVVAYVAATEYESAIDKCQYLSPCYAIQSLFSILCIIFAIQIFCKEIKKPKNIPEIKAAKEAVKADKYYVDKNKNKINLETMSLEKLENLNYEEETYFAKEIKKLPAFSKKRNQYLKKAYQKIFQISDYKKLKNQKSSKANGVNDYIIELLNRLIAKKTRKNKKILFYEAGVGKAEALKNLNKKNLNIKGCDIFLSKEAKEIEKIENNISLVENSLYEALDEIDDNSLDIFYADNVLEHIVEDEYEKTCQKIVTKIKPKGLAILIIPNSYVGPSDISRLKLNIGHKALGFHFMEQTFNEVVKFFKKEGMQLTYFCMRSKKGEIRIIYKDKILNFLKIKLEKTLAKIKNSRNRRRIFKLLGYNIYILDKK